MSIRKSSTRSGSRASIHSRFISLPRCGAAVGDLPPPTRSESGSGRKSGMGGEATKAPKKHKSDALLRKHKTNNNDIRTKDEDYFGPPETPFSDNFPIMYVIKIRERE